MSSTLDFLDLAVPPEDREVRDAVWRVLSSGTYVLGPEVEAFEAEFSEYIGAEYCIGVNSGTAALELILRAMGVGEGDEVLVPAYTAIATWMAVSEVGATPVGVDVDSLFGMDPVAAAAARTDRTRAAIVVHLLGRPADFHTISASLPGLPLIEDCAQAHGARIRDARVGSLGIAAAFSFYPTKNLACLGDGGAVVTSDPDVAERVRLFRSYGWRERSESLIKAGNSRLDEVQAAVLRVRLRRLDDENAKRQRLARLMSDLLATARLVTVPSGAEWASSVWHLYVVQTKNPDALARDLKEHGIGTLRHYAPLPHQTPAFRSLKTTYPIAERLAEAALSLPLHPRLAAADIERVAAAVGEK